MQLLNVHVPTEWCLRTDFTSKSEPQMILDYTPVPLVYRHGRRHGRVSPPGMFQILRQGKNKLLYGHPFSHGHKQHEQFPQRLESPQTTESPRRVHDVNDARWAPCTRHHQRPYQTTTNGSRNIHHFHVPTLQTDDHMRSVVHYLLVFSRGWYTTRSTAAQPIFSPSTLQPRRYDFASHQTERSVCFSEAPALLEQYDYPASTEWCLHTNFKCRAEWWAILDYKLVSLVYRFVHGRRHGRVSPPGMFQILRRPKNKLLYGRVGFVLSWA